MSVTPEELMALADGELSGEAAARVEAAIAADPVLARRLEAERGLRAALRGRLDPVAQEPVPLALTDLIARAAAAADAGQGMTDKVAPAPAPSPAEVVDLAAARTRRKEAEKARDRAARRPNVPIFADRRMAFAIAASLVLGLMLGSQLHREGPVTQTRAGLAASGSLARTLDRQLASAGDVDGLRMLASFRRQGGDYCRVFAGTATSGIACRRDGTWLLERTMAGGGGPSSDYRQAGSVQGDMLAAAQDMMRGDPLDAAQERAAIEKGWR
jgi:anti-sigma factor RsiW